MIREKNQKQKAKNLVTVPVRGSIYHRCNTKVVIYELNKSKNKAKYKGTVMSQREYIRKGQDPTHNWLHGPIQPCETVPLSVGVAGLPVSAGGKGVMELNMTTAMLKRHYCR
jgi:hypothetical protein